MKELNKSIEKLVSVLTSARQTCLAVFASPRKKFVILGIAALAIIPACVAEPPATPQPQDLTQASLTPTASDLETQELVDADNAEIDSPNVLFAGITGAVTLAPSEVIRGTQFQVSVGFNNAPWSGYHCVNVRLTATNGFSVLTRSPQTINDINGGQSGKVTFTVQAPAQGDRTGSLSVWTEWKTVPGCKGTASSQQGTANVTSRNPWIVTLSVIPPCTKPDNGVFFLLRDTNGQQIGRKSVTYSPFAASFEILPKPSTYSAYSSWACTLGLPNPSGGPSGGLTAPPAITKNISVTKNNQVFSMK